jgi:hypothetical protein
MRVRWAGRSGLSAALLFSGAALAQPLSVMPTPGTLAPMQTHIVWEQRGFFNALRLRRDLRRLCGGAQPYSVEVIHDAGDVAAAIFTGILWTPAHLRVTCGG